VVLDEDWIFLVLARVEEFLFDELLRLLVLVWLLCEADLILEALGYFSSSYYLGWVWEEFFGASSLSESLRDSLDCLLRPLIVASF